MLVGRKAKTESNIVRNPPRLPIPLYFGGLSCSCSLEQSPTAQIEYEGVLPIDLAQIESEYSIGRRLKIYSLPFEVKSYGYSKDKCVVTDVYKVTVALQWAYERQIVLPIKVVNLPINLVSSSERGKPRVSRRIAISAIARQAEVPYKGPEFYVELPPEADLNTTITLKEALEQNARRFGCCIYYEDGVSLRRLSDCQNYTFPKGEVISDGANTISIPVAYNKTEVAGRFSKPLQKNATVTGLTPFYRREPVIKTIVEVDDQVTLPPKGTLILKGLDSNADFSGPKKSQKITTTVNDSPETEELFIYGFSYLLEDMIYLDVDEPLITNPQGYWGIVEHRKTQYIYKPLPPIAFNVSVRDPVTGMAKMAIVHPDYQDFVVLKGNVLYLNLPVRYQVESITTGIKQVRYVKEQQSIDNENVGDTREGLSSPFYPLFKFFYHPLEARTANWLRPSRMDYKDEGGSVFSVDLQKYDNLDPRIASIVDDRFINSNNQVAVVIPNITYVEPMLVWAETSAANSFSFVRNPNTSPDDPKPPIVTGEETFNQTIRQKTGINRFKEKTTEFSSQDAGFDTSLETIRFADKIGRPPEANTRRVDWEIQDQELPGDPLGPLKRTRYYLYSDDIEFTASGGTASYETADTVEEARLAAETDLVLKEMQANQSSKNIAWFHPYLKPGDVIATEGDRFGDKGSWRISSNTWRLTFKGRATRFDPFCTTDGTQVTLGLARERLVDIRTVSEDSLAGGDITIETNLGEQIIGSIFLNTPSRRNFNV